MPRNEIEGLWAQMVDAENAFYGARRHLVVSVDAFVELVPVLRKALRTRQRGTALRLLLVLDDETRRGVFPELFDLAGIGHSDIDLVRRVIALLPTDWVNEQMAVLLVPALANGADEEFRRYAELLVELGSPLLALLVEEAHRRSDPHIREVAEDYSEAAALCA